jgi:signal transduction histidine kinase
MIRVLVNLLDNAIEASEPSSPIWIYASSDGPEVTIEVHDSGIGMEPDVLERACEFSFTTRMNRGGMGCGLSISKDIIDGRDGRFHLESSLGEGTRAIVVLPYNEVPIW